ncbi:Uncharacterised protein [Segatella copri]|nr:Uncharacterised protein [Segatella copri]
MCVSHLRCDGTLPDEFVKALLLSGSFDGWFIHICRTDSLVRFLCTL